MHFLKLLWVRIPPFAPNNQNVAQFGRAHALGAWGCKFKSCHFDQFTIRINDMFNIGDTKTVKCNAPASIYFKFNNEKVTIIGISFIKKGNEDVPVYTFRHNEYGFGAMFEHGFI